MFATFKEVGQFVLEQLERGVPHLQHAHHGVVPLHVHLGGLQSSLVVEPAVNRDLDMCSRYVAYCLLVLSHLRHN